MRNFKFYYSDIKAQENMMGWAYSWNRRHKECCWGNMSGNDHFERWGDGRMTLIMISRDG
jgi:hypothetical protein